MRPAKKQKRFNPCEFQLVSAPQNNVLRCEKNPEMPLVRIFLVNFRLFELLEIPALHCWALGREHPDKSQPDKGHNMKLASFLTSIVFEGKNKKMCMYVPKCLSQKSIESFVTSLRLHKFSRSYLVCCYSECFSCVE